MNLIGSCPRTSGLEAQKWWIYFKTFSASRSSTYYFDLLFQLDGPLRHVVPSNHRMARMQSQAKFLATIWVNSKHGVKYRPRNGYHWRARSNTMTLLLHQPFEKRLKMLNRILNELKDLESSLTFHWNHLLSQKPGQVLGLIGTDHSQETTAHSFTLTKMCSLQIFL